MANQVQLDILKQGVEAWNKWREDNKSAEIDLADADLTEASLNGANLRYANMVGVNLAGVELEGSDLWGSDLSEADLRWALLRKTYLWSTILRQTNLERAMLDVADFWNADLTGANLTGADLRGAIFRGAIMNNATLDSASVQTTIFDSTDLSTVISLETMRHLGASAIGTETLVLSKGRLPEAFMRGCGLRDWEIEAAKLYNPELDNEERNKILYKIHDLQVSQAVQISPLFISYSHVDGDFVDRMEKSLNEKGIRFWRDIHDMKAGRMEKQIDRAIRQNPTVLLILSENSIGSDWVQHEVRLARELEKDTEIDVLCPVTLDDSWKSSPWPERIMDQVMEYNILDFSNWEDDVEFEKMFTRLIDGLNIFYKKEEE